MADYSKYKKYDDEWKRSIPFEYQLDPEVNKLIQRKNYLSHMGDELSRVQNRGATGAGARPYWRTPKSINSGNFNPRYLNKLPIDQTPTNFQDIPRQPLLNIDRDRPRIPPAAYKPDERPWYFNPSWEGVKDAGQEVMRQGEGFLGGVNNYFKKLFNDPARLAQIQTSLALMNPSLRYDQGPKGLEVDNPWGAFGKAMQVGQKSYMDAINRPMRYTTNSFGQVIDKMTGKVMANQGGAGSMPLDGRQTFFYNEMKKSNPNLTPADIKFNRVQIPTELISRYAEMNRANFNMNTTYESEFAKKQAGKDADMIENIGTASGVAMASNDELDGQLSILTDPTKAHLFGPMADFRQTGREIASLFGFDYSNDMSSYQMFAKSSMTQLLNQLKEQKGPQTEGDALRALKTLPKMGNTVLANKYILLMRKAVNDRAIAQDRFLQKYMYEGMEAIDLETGKPVIDKKTNEVKILGGKGDPRGFRDAWSRYAPEAQASIFERMYNIDQGILLELVQAGLMSQATLDQVVANIN